MISSKVRLTDVSPRDGLQNESKVIPTQHKAELVARLFRSGVDEVEVTSFVSPKWIPQLGDADALLEIVAQWPGKRPMLSALVPNLQGMERLMEANAKAMLQSGRKVIDKVSVFTAASETFCKRNTNATIAETLQRFAPVCQKAKESGLLVRGYVSCVVACPFEGRINPSRVAEVAAQLLAVGADEIDLGDTIGAARATDIAPLLQAVNQAINPNSAPLTLHLHDTFANAAECVAVALECGVRSFDASVGGLGGCPYAGTANQRAPGNISMEVLINAIRKAGYSVDVEDENIEKTAAFARGLVGMSEDRR